MTVLKLHTEPLKEEWLDAYGHLNEAYYLVPFTNTTWILQDHFGIGSGDYFETTGCALYTVESHLRYLREVRFPADMEIETVIFGSDAKRIRFAHIMKVEGKDCATFECMLLHYDTRAGRTAPLPEEVQEKLKAAEVMELPDWAGRRVTFEKG